MRILFTTILFLFTICLHGQIIHIKGVETIGASYNPGKYGWGATLDYTKYLSNEFHLSGEINYDRATPTVGSEKSHTTIEEIVGIVSANYSFLKFSGTYLNARAGLFTGAEILTEPKLDENENRFTFGGLIGAKAEFWYIPKIGISVGFDQMFKIKGVDYNTGGTPKYGHRWYYTIGVNYQIQ